MKTLAFLNVENRDADADGQSLSVYKAEVGDEMIVTLDDETQEATTDTNKGSFRFTNLKPEELSPYVSLQELKGVRCVDGHYQVGKSPMKNL